VASSAEVLPRASAQQALAIVVGSGRPSLPLEPRHQLARGFSGVELQPQQLLAQDLEAAAVLVLLRRVRRRPSAVAHHYSVETNLRQQDLVLVLPLEGVALRLAAVSLAVEVFLPVLDLALQATQESARILAILLVPPWSPSPRPLRRKPTTLHKATRSRIFCSWTHTKNGLPRNCD